MKNQLDQYQRKIITTEGNLMVIAGAGCGKTFTLLNKIDDLIKNGYLEKEILIISFTNASVEDIKKKLSYEIDTFTFHKLAMTILDKAKVNYSIENTHLLSYIIHDYLKKANKKEQRAILNYIHYSKNYHSFLKSIYFNSFQKLIHTFINQFKTNSLNYQAISKIKFFKNEKNILLIIFNILKIYEEEKNSTSTFDFDDLIIKTNNLELIKRAQLTYKYIIIDEFQDTSWIRLNLIKSIYEVTHSTIIIVGDDWQIYRFSGCDLNVFLNFPQIIDNVRKIELLKTYRNSQDLLDIAKKFVERNPHQIKKELISDKNLKSPVKFIPYANPITQFKNLILSLNKEGKTNILVISRNNKDIYNYIDEDFTLTNDYLTFKDIEMTYLTIHRSKGLESDTVIILNCDNTTCGFPNKIEECSIIRKVFSAREIPFAEERRLMYVALTRTKNEVYLLYNKKSPSIFIKELKKIVKSLDNT